MIVTTDLVLCIVFPVLAILAVTGRFWARHLKNLPLKADDWTILIALVIDAVEELPETSLIELGILHRKWYPRSDWWVTILCSRVTAIRLIESIH